MNNIIILKRSYFVSFLFLMLANYYCIAQDTSNLSLKRLLQLDDFKSIPDYNVRWKAFSWIGLKYNYSNPRNCQDKKIKFDFLVSEVFEEKRSWFKKEHLSNDQIKVILDHEQQHYNIGEVMSNEIFAQLSSYCFDKARAKNQIDSIVKMNYNYYYQIQLDYDYDVYYRGNNQKNQESWNSKIKIMLIESRQKRKLAETKKNQF
jgi:hypothetical protein